MREAHSRNKAVSMTGRGRLRQRAGGKAGGERGKGNSVGMVGDWDFK